MNRHALSASGPKPGASTNFATPAPAPCPFQVRVRILANGKKALMLLVVLTLALMIMVMTAAAFTFLVIMMVPATALTVPVVMMMVAAAALAFFVIVVMMPAATFAFRVVMMVAATALTFPVIMMMLAAAALTFLMIVVMMTATALAFTVVMVMMTSATTATAAASMPARKRHGFKGRLNLFDGQPDAFEQLLELSIERKGKTTLGLRNTNAACHQGIHCLLHQIHIAGYLEDCLDASLDDVEMAAFINQNVTNFQRPGFPKRILQLLACNRFKGLGQLQAISICQDNLVSACKQSRGRS